MAKKRKVQSIYTRRKGTRAFSVIFHQDKKNIVTDIEPIVLKAMTCCGISMAHEISLSELDEGFNIALKEVRSNGNKI